MGNTATSESCLHQSQYMTKKRGREQCCGSNVFYAKEEEKNIFLQSANKDNSENIAILYAIILEHVTQLQLEQIWENYDVENKGSLSADLFLNMLHDLFQGIKVLLLEENDKVDGHKRQLPHQVLQQFKSYLAQTHSHVDDMQMARLWRDQFDLDTDQRIDKNAFLRMGEGEFLLKALSNYLETKHEVQNVKQQQQPSDK